MGDLSLEIRGQIDDVDGVKWAFLWADTATDAQPFGDEGDFGGVVHFDAQLARTDNRTGLLAFLSTFLPCVRETPCGKRRLLALGLHYRGEHPHVSLGQNSFVEG